MNASKSPSALVRWLRFNVVGVGGVGIQLGVLKVLLNRTAIDYRVATLIAIEVTLIHNFFWHVIYTWRERRFKKAGILVSRLLQFHLSNGLVSLAGSWTLMTLLVTKSGLSAMLANCVSIAACSVINFLLAELLVFRTSLRRRSGRQRPIANQGLFVSP